MIVLGWWNRSTSRRVCLSADRVVDGELVQLGVERSCVCHRRIVRECEICDHKMPESLRAFCSMVSLTAANTNRIFEVSVACVK